MDSAFKSPRVPVSIGGHDLFLLYSIPALAGLQSALGAATAADMLARVDSMVPRGDDDHQPDTAGLLELLRAGLQVSSSRAGVDVDTLLEEMTPGEIVAFIAPMFDALFRALGTGRSDGTEVAADGASGPTKTATGA